MPRSTYVDLFIEEEKLQVNVKMEMDVKNGNYPVIRLSTDLKGIRIFPTMEQVKQLQQALNEFVGANEKPETAVSMYLKCRYNKNIHHFTVGKEYPVLDHDKDKGIYQVADDEGDYRFLEMPLWDQEFKIVYK